MRVVCLILTSMCSCSVGPTVIKSDGTKIMLGASLFERTTDENASIVTTDGTRIEFSKRSKDQTAVAKEGVRAWATVAGIKASGDALNEGEAIRK